MTTRYYEEWECDVCEGSGAGEEQTPWKTNPCEACDGVGGQRRELTGTIETVGEPGYYDHHGNDGAFVAPGRYLVIPLEEPADG